jgi:hypothetical protein
MTDLKGQRNEATKYKRTVFNHDVRNRIILGGDVYRNTRAGLALNVPLGLSF